MAQKLVELESGRRFSASALWDWQADYFRRSGIAAWAGSLPFYATSNPFIADRYAQVIHRYLLELGRLDGTAAGQPVHIVELGAGPGQFAFYCASRLAELCAAAPPAVRPVYVMTDLAPAMLDFWRTQPGLARLAASGWLDMAVFDIDRPAALDLSHSGGRIEAGMPAAGVVCIANYVFDSTRHDAFALQAGRLAELRPSLRVPAGKLTPGRPPRLADVTVQFQRLPVQADGHYAQPVWNEVLAAYAAAIRNGGFVFPTAMLSALEYLRACGDGRLLLLASDKGYAGGEIADRSPPVLTRHDRAFSIEVNFDALRRVVERDGGLAAQQPSGDGLFTGAYLWRNAGEAMAETAGAASALLQGFGPYDFMNLYRALREAPVAEPRAILALLRLARWDPHVLSRLAGRILEGGAIRQGSFRRALRSGLSQAEALIYRKPAMPDYDFELARLAQGLTDHENALRLYAQSIEHAGDSAATRFNMAECHHALGRPDLARMDLQQCLALDPRNAEARDFLERLEPVQGPEGHGLSTNA